MTAFFFLPFAGPLLWIALIALIVAATRGTRGAGRESVRVLEDRYARGEITREEFIERRSVLDGTAHR